MTRRIWSIIEQEIDDAVYALTAERAQLFHDILHKIEDEVGVEIDPEEYDGILEELRRAVDIDIDIDYDDKRLDRFMNKMKNIHLY